MSKPTLLLCYRKADMPVPSARSFTDACRQCGAAIWVAYSSPSHIKRLCMQCGLPLLKEDDTVGVTESQIADVEATMKRKPQ
jgi:hypothetical protein